MFDLLTIAFGNSERVLQGQILLFFGVFFKSLQSEGLASGLILLSERIMTQASYNLGTCDALYMYFFLPVLSQLSIKGSD